MNRYDLTTKAMPVVEELCIGMNAAVLVIGGLRVGKSHHTHQANLAMLGSHHSSDWDFSSNAPDLSYCDSD